MTRLSVPNSVELLSMLMTPGAIVNMSVLTMVGGRGFSGSLEAAETSDALLNPIMLTS